MFKTREMSAEIDSSESLLGSHQVLGLGEMATGVDQLKIDGHVADAADFLLANSKYHDCLLVVGNPDTDEVESIGAASLHLIAHSPVLREMLENNRAKEPSDSKIHVTDVSPAIFKLMLRFVYGGKLPQMTAIEAAGLALCADKFKIPRLVQKALKRLDPTSAEDVFPALICVSCIRFPELELKVRNIVQKETEKIVEHSDFLELDEDCVIFILKQNALNLSELELWQNVVLWAQNQVKVDPTATIRDCLFKILGYVRFLTFTSEEILEHVLPTKVLTPEEFVDLTLAVTKNQPLCSTALCKIKEKRNCPQKSFPKITRPSHVQLMDKTEFSVYSFPYKLVLVENKLFSNFDIKPSQSIEIESFTFKSIQRQFDNKIFLQFYTYTCDVTVTKSMKGAFVSQEEIRVEGDVVVNEEITLPIKLENGQPLVIFQEETCSINLHFYTAHPVHKLVREDSKSKGLIGFHQTHHSLTSSGIRVTYKDYFHVVKIAYKAFSGRPIRL